VASLGAIAEKRTFVRRFILTGAPGSGKTSILRALADMGYAVVEEAATDANTAALARGEAEPWTDPLFIDRIVRLQHHRLAEPVPAGAAAQVHDRSAVCTLALARWLGRPVTATLRGELAEITGTGTFDRRVFFVRPIGFCQPTAVRRISYSDSLRFERVHESEYRRLGFEIVDVPAGAVGERAAMIDACIRSWA
jgi:predicted ATPase